jgi:hypothetical protein
LPSISLALRESGRPKTTPADVPNVSSGAPALFGVAIDQPDRRALTPASRSQSVKTLLTTGVATLFLRSARPAEEALALLKDGVRPTDVAKQLQIARSSVYRIIDGVSQSSQTLNLCLSSLIPEINRNFEAKTKARHHLAGLCFSLKLSELHPSSLES